MLESLSVGVPYLSGGSIMVPVTNLTSHTVGDGTTVQFKAWATVASPTVPPFNTCWVGHCGTFPSASPTTPGGITYVQCTPQNSCWTDCSPRYLSAQAKDNARSVFVVSPHTSAQAGCLRAPSSKAYDVQGARSIGPTEISSSYFAFPLLNPSDRSLRSTVEVRALQPQSDEATFRSLLDDLPLMTTMANRQLKFGAARAWNVSLGSEALSRPPFELEAPERDAHVPSCDCAAHGVSREAEPHAGFLGHAGIKGPTYGSLGPQDVRRLVPHIRETAAKKETKLLVEQLPWQESQVIVRVDYQQSDRLVTLFRFEQFPVLAEPTGSSKKAIETAAQPAFVFEFIALPPYNPFV